MQKKKKKKQPEKLQKFARTHRDHDFFHFIISEKKKKKYTPLLSDHETSCTREEISRGGK